MKRSKRNGMLRRAALLSSVLVFVASTFAVTAFATEITPVPDPAAPVESTVDPGIPGDSTVNPIIPDADPNTQVDPTIPPATDPNTGTLVDPNAPAVSSDSGISPPFDPSAPVTSPGEEVPPAENPSDPNASSNPDGTSLPEGTESQPESSEVEVSTPEEDPEEEPYQPPASQKPAVSVNTDNAEINQNASRAAEATSDPDLLSSQDWSELLTSGEVSQSPNAKPFENTPQGNGDGNSEEKQGSFSWILPLGIALIVLGLGGIAFFVYAQFFAPRRRSAFDDTGEIEEFTDISSDSSGVQQREDYLFSSDEEQEELSEQTGQPEESQEAPVSQEIAEEVVTETEAPATATLSENVPVQEKFEIVQPDVRFVEDGKPGETSSGNGKDVGESPYGFKVEIMKDQKDENGNFDWDSFFDDPKDE